jgi:hypothetical protein
MRVSFIVTRYSEFLQAISVFACLNSNPAIDSLHYVPFMLNNSIKLKWIWNLNFMKFKYAGKIHF